MVARVVMVAVAVSLEAVCSGVTREAKVVMVGMVVTVGPEAPEAAKVGKVGKVGMLAKVVKEEVVKEEVVKVAVTIPQSRGRNRHSCISSCTC